MRKRYLCLAAVIVGALLIALPYAIAFVACEISADASGVSIIGGADGPTALFIIQEVSREYFWLPCLGIGMILASVVALLWKRK